VVSLRSREQSRERFFLLGAETSTSPRGNAVRVVSPLRGFGKRKLLSPRLRVGLETFRVFDA